MNVSMRTFFDTIDTESKAYWLGFLTADGNLHRNGYNIQINLARKDKIHLEKFGAIVECQTQDYENKKDGKIHLGCYLCISDSHMHESLCNLGIVPNKTLADQSVVFNYLPYNLIHHFIRGLFDGDGSVTSSWVKGKLNSNFSIAGEERILTKLRDIMCDKLGLGKIEIEKHEHYAVLRWGGRRQIECIKNWMYQNATIWLERKRNKFETIKHESPLKGTFFGVSKASSGKWNASIIHNGKREHLGNFNTPEEAAMIHDVRAREIGKPKYKINFQESGV